MGNGSATAFRGLSSGALTASSINGSHCKFTQDKLVLRQGTALPFC